MKSAGDDVKRLKKLLEESEKENARLRDDKESFRKLYELVRLETERLKRQLFGQKAEKVPTAQLDLLFAPVEESLAKAKGGDEGALEKTMSALDKLREQARTKALEKKKSNQRKGGRRKLSEEDIPVDRVIIEPPERLVEGGENLIKIGEEVSTHIEWRPGSLVKVEVVRPKYKMPKEPKNEESVDDDAPKTKIVIADVPERPIAKGMAGPGLIAHVIVAKYGDHLPLHRQERIFKRQGLKVSRSTLQGWIFGVTQMLSYITKAMWEDTKKNAHWVGVDATGVLVQQVDKCRRGHFWVVIADFGHVIYRFTDVENGDVVAKLLEGFSGYIQADASAVYHELYRRERSLVEVACWAHLRRKFFEALSTSEDLALIGIGMIRLLFEAHDAAKSEGFDLDTQEGRDLLTVRRAELAKPILKGLYAWIEQERPALAEDAPVRKAMNYCLNHKVALHQFLEDGSLRLDNNLSELALRQEVVGRKNWLFLGSNSGATANVTCVTLYASCMKAGVEPEQYFREVLTILPVWPQTKVLELAPLYWAKTRARPETQQLLKKMSLIDYKTLAA